MVLPRLRKGVRVLTVAVLGLIITAAPASASPHEIYLDDWWDYGRNWAYVNYDHTVVCANDGEEDGHGVYVEYRGPGSIHGFVWDGNGSRSGYSCLKVKKVTSFRLCEDDWGSPDCTAWKYI